MAIVYFSYLFICFSITEDNCIQCLSLFNFYASSFKFYSSKFCYFRYGDLKDLKKKKIFLLAPTHSYSSPAGFFSIPGRFFIFRNWLLVADASAGNRSYEVRQISVPTHTIELPTRTDWAEHNTTGFI